MQDEISHLDDYFLLHSLEDDDDKSITMMNSSNQYTSTEDPFECFFSPYVNGNLSNESSTVSLHREEISSKPLRKQKTSSNWTDEEDLLLQEYSLLYNNSWKQIALMFNNKSPKQCAYRYAKQKNNYKYGRFRQIDDIQLIQLIKKGNLDFESIHKEMPQFTIEQMKTRLTCYLLPKTSRKMKRESILLEQEISDLASLNTKGAQVISPQLLDDLLSSIKSLKSLFKLLLKENQRVVKDNINVKIYLLNFVVLQKQEGMFSELRKIMKQVISDGQCSLFNALLLNKIQSNIIRIGKLIILLLKQMS